MARVSVSKVSGLAAVLALSVLTGGGVSFARDARLERVAFDTGVVTLGPTQVLRVVISSPPAGSGATWQWRKQVRQYAKEAGYEKWCEIQSCILREIGRQQSDPVMMTGDSAAVFDLLPYMEADTYRVLVGVSDRAASVAAFVIDRESGAVVLSITNKNPDISGTDYD
jgi:hypothetical protein